MRNVFGNVAKWIGRATAPPQGLAFLPAVTLAAYWLGGEQALLLAALAVPLLLVAGQTNAPAPPAKMQHAPAERTAAIGTLDRALHESVETGLQTGAMAVLPDDMATLEKRLGQQAVQLTWSKITERLQQVLRDDDIIAWGNDGALLVALAPIRRADLEVMLQISGRVLDTIREPISVAGTTLYLSGTAGFCLQSRNPGTDGSSLAAAAETALQQARRHGAGAIRAFSAEMQRSRSWRQNTRDELETAFDQGHIQPWFQPQLSTDTGRISGFEALARWNHPERGLIPPADFLDAVIDTGLSVRLSEAMLYGALSALRAWDRAGISVPTVGVNFSGEELCNPDLVEKIRWELDRFSLPPERLSVEVLETVASGPGDDILHRNISELGRMGCGIDLDDFGTGNASIASIRRFSATRLKIDRSFVTRVDRDQDQQNMVAAILTMAEQLGLQTLAEGVETPGEHAVLAQLGCGHVQGFGIARPMPLDQSMSWIQHHHAKLHSPPKLGQQQG